MYDVDFEMLVELAENGEEEDVTNLGNYCYRNRKDLFRGKYIDINGKRLYPIVERNAIVAWEWD